MKKITRTITAQEYTVLTTDLKPLGLIAIYDGEDLSEYLNDFAKSKGLKVNEITYCLTREKTEVHEMDLLTFINNSTVKESGDK